MEEKNKYWFRALIHYEQNRYIRNGLTIPFLIGSKRIIDVDKSTQSIADFIYDITATISSTQTIMRCPHIGEYVIGILDNESKIMYDKYLDSRINQFGSLTALDDSFIDINNTEELISHFQDLYQNEIEQNHYSKENGIWSNYNELDLSRLAQIIA